MNDDEYWNTSQHARFDFNFEDSSSENSFDVLRIHSLPDCIKDIDDYFNTHTFESESGKCGESDENVQVKIERNKKILLEENSPEETIKKMLSDKKYNLTQYKSLSDKQQLLLHAVKSHDGNVIIEVVLFLKATLKTSIFITELLKSVIATNHYYSYLRLDNRWDELSDMYLRAGNYEDAAIAKYYAALCVTDSEKKLNKLKECTRTVFSCSSLPHTYTETLQSYINLLEWQFPIQKMDSDAKLDVQDIFKKNGRLNILDLPPITTLYYSCCYHHDLMENLIASPAAIKKALKLNEKQFLWVTVHTLAYRQKWSKLDDLILKKNRQERAKILACIGASNIVEILIDTEAPSEILKTYLQFVSDSSERLELAKKHGCHSLVIKTLIDMQDRAAMKQHIETLIPDSNEYNEAVNALNSIRKKN